MKIVGYFSTSAILAIALIGLNKLSGNNFIWSFIDSYALTISTTLLGFNIAIHTILVGQINNIENTMGKIGYFKKTRSELKQNALFNVLLICVIFLANLLKISPEGILYTTIPSQYINQINGLLSIIVMSSVILIIFLILETIQAVYKIYDFKTKTSK